MHIGKTMVLSEKEYNMTVYLDKQNKRVRVEDYLGSLSNVMDEAEKIVESEKADKLIIKGRREHFSELLERGYIFEASIDGFFLGSDCVFFSKFLSDERRISPHCPRGRNHQKCLSFGRTCTENQSSKRLRFEKNGRN